MTKRYTDIPEHRNDNSDTQPLLQFPLASMGKHVQPTLTDVTLVTKEEDLPDDLYKPGLKLFVCSVDAALQRKCVDACDTLTTSLGPVR